MNNIEINENKEINLNKPRKNSNSNKEISNKFLDCNFKPYQEERSHHKTILIEEPSMISNLSEEEDKKNGDIIKEKINEFNEINKKMTPHLEKCDSNEIQKDFPSAMSLNIKIKKNIDDNSKKSPRKSRFTTKKGKALQKTNSNSNFEIKSDGKSDYTRTSIKEFFINDNKKNVEFNLKDNTITTTKYNFITFLPKGLLYQFARLPNVYFLITAIIQSIPIISPLNSLTAIVPLIFVLGVSMIRELIEDLGRNKYDQINNQEEVIVLRNGKFTKSRSSSLKSGEIVLIHENNEIPADLVLIDSGMREGECYVETSSLDGEKALKFKIANKKIYEIFHKKVKSFEKHIEKIETMKISGFVQVINPNSNLNQIDGKLSFFIQDNDIFKEDNCSITMKEFLLKGSILKNTNWIVGIII